MNRRSIISSVLGLFGIAAVPRIVGATTLRSKLPPFDDTMDAVREAHDECVAAQKLTSQFNPPHADRSEWACEQLARAVLSLNARVRELEIRLSDHE